MKVGDLVKMKPMMFWAAKNNKHFTYTDKPGVVIEGGSSPIIPYAMVSVLVGSRVYRGMASEWEVVSGKG